MDPYLKLIAQNKWVENDLLFPSKIGMPMITFQLRTDFIKRLTQAGLHSIKLHHLRHTTATLMENLVTPIPITLKNHENREIQENFGNQLHPVAPDFLKHKST
jgi:integrase